MKAALCRTFGAPLMLEDVELAAPSHHEVEVTIKACAICHSDILYAEGAWGGSLPSIYGHEAAGIVTALGANVEGLKIGDHVVVTLIRSCGFCHHCANGRQVLCQTKFPLDRHSPLRDAAGRTIHQGLRTAAFAERVVVDASQIVPVDRDLPFASASLLACGVLTGVGAVVNTARVRPGARVGIIGTGGVGLNAVQGSVIAGASQIIAIDRQQVKLQTALDLGATDAILVEEDNVAVRVAKLTKRQRLDFVFVTVGSKAAMVQAMELLAPGGRLVIVGMPPSGTEVPFAPDMLASGEVQIIGSKMGSAQIARDVPWLISMVRQGRLELDRLVSNQFALDEINEAIACSLEGVALRNVVCP